MLISGTALNDKYHITSKEAHLEKKYFDSEAVTDIIIIVITHHYQQIVGTSAKWITCLVVKSGRRAASLQHDH